MLFQILTYYCIRLLGNGEDTVNQKICASLEKTAPSPLVSVVAM